LVFLAYLIPISLAYRKGVWFYEEEVRKMGRRYGEYTEKFRVNAE